MSPRKEDELDLEAMEIARQIKKSDNLRIPRNPEQAGRDLMRVVSDLTRVVRKDGAA